MEKILDNKRIVKNTTLLYARMLLTMFVGLFTSRIVLQVLGDEDYGIYTVVGGIVVLLSFINSTMAVATQRFLSYEIGKGDEKNLNEVFCVSLGIHILIAVVMLVLSETVGLWFLQTQLNIPEERMMAANVVYQFSVVTTLLGITQIPYNALIIAREKMEVFAYISVLEVCLKLALICVLFFVTYDKLELYALLMFINSTVILLIYRSYCIHNFMESKFHVVRNKKAYKQISAFAGWNLGANMVLVARTQGTNMLINIFAGLLFNSARGIAVQVNTIISQFVINFQMAVNPQITKLYAVGELKEMNKLVFRSSKFSFFLLSLLVMPLIFETEEFLALWLGYVPKYSVEFTRFTLIASLFDCLSGLLSNTALATGKVKVYQIVMSLLLSLCFFLSWLLLHYGCNPICVYWVDCTIYFIGMFVRLLLLKRMIQLSPWGYIKDVLAPNILSITPVVIIGIIIVSNFDKTLWRLVIDVVLLVTVSIVSSLYLGMTKDERFLILKIVKNRLKLCKK